ncbi:NUDIX domain-containing protein [Bradyrhizobium sp. 146]|uniref:NUDIX domain-containing protein n=1 Tax=Bradyrhizobium sp. 146 TaxID=2782622 RepID=UPI001FF8D399|nr:NUDIX domain-containing protein [Bradyrhizobium sp. 146]MCK1699909.1 NUDIX domain-containing protein [Bradyrhizobium sp. 146]
MSELVLSARSISLPKLTGGFRPARPAEIKRLLSQAELWFGPRSVLEGDSSFRQIIPYIVLVNDGQIVAYERAKHGSEARLHSKLSVGLGGHIGLDDAVTSGGKLNAWRTILAAADRELKEELSAIDIIETRWHGFVSDDASSVGRVHLGIIAFSVSRSRPKAKDRAVRRLRLLTLEALGKRQEELEPWSAVVLRALRPQLIAAVDRMGNRSHAS